jgi:hypothetical protein
VPVRTLARPIIQQRLNGATPIGNGAIEVLGARAAPRPHMMSRRAVLLQSAASA